MYRLGGDDVDEEMVWKNEVGCPENARRYSVAATCTSTGATTTTTASHDTHPPRRPKRVLCSASSAAAWMRSRSRLPPRSCRHGVRSA